MLSRTADNLYWLSRYVERAEYLARILEATHRRSALPLAYVGTSNQWESAVATAWAEFDVPAYPITWSKELCASRMMPSPALAISICASSSSAIH